MDVWRRSYLRCETVEALIEAEIAWFFGPDDRIRPVAEARRRSLTRLGSFCISKNYVQLDQSRRPKTAARLISHDINSLLFHANGQPID